MHDRLEDCWCSCEYARTCQSNNIQCGASHIDVDVEVDNIRVVLVQLRKPDISHLGSLLVEYWSEERELPQSKGWILREDLE